MSVQKGLSDKVWHQRLGYVPMAVLRRIPMFRNKVVFFLKYCDICPLSRQTRIYYPTSITASIEAFLLIHMDVCGLYKFKDYDGMESFLTLVDD